MKAFSFSFYIYTKSVYSAFQESINLYFSKFCVENKNIQSFK